MSGGRLAVAPNRDALCAPRVLASYDYRLVEQTVGAHGVPAGIAAVLFAGVIAWELLAAGLFWRAWVAFRRDGDGAGHEVTQAFVVGVALWAAFLIATHKGTLIAQIVTLRVRSGATPVADR